MTRGWLALVGGLFLSVALGGCTYSTRNALPPHLKTIAVPMFVNRTYVEDYRRKLEVEVTEAVRAAIIQVGELKLAGRESADIILEGEVSKLDRQILRTDGLGDPAEVRIIIRAKVSAYDVKEAKYLFKSQSITNAEMNGESGVYNMRRGEDENFGIKRALEDLGRVIARRVTERWPAPKEKKEEAK